MDKTIKQILASHNVDVEQTINRFSGNEDLFEKHLFRLPSDPTYIQLQEAVANNDAGKSMEAVHTLKGVSGNLGITPLFKATSDMVAAIRNSSTEPLSVLFEPVQKAYDDIVAVLKNCEDM